MYTVTISERGKPPVKLDFDKPEITIGRVRGNDIVLQKNNVSKRHAKLIVKEGQFIIIDQKSTNGTIVNARKITAPQVVREDDKICIGDFILTLKYEDRPTARPASGPVGPAPVPMGSMAGPGGPPLGPAPGPLGPLSPPPVAPLSPPGGPPPGPVLGRGPLDSGRGAPPPGIVELGRASAPPTGPSEPLRPTPQSLPPGGAPAPGPLGSSSLQPPVRPPSGPAPVVEHGPAPVPRPPVRSADLPIVEPLGMAQSTLRPGGPPQILAELRDVPSGERFEGTPEAARPRPDAAPKRSTLAGFGNMGAEAPTPPPAASPRGLGAAPPVAPAAPSAPASGPALSSGPYAAATPGPLPMAAGPAPAPAMAPPAAMPAPAGPAPSAPAGPAAMPPAARPEPTPVAPAMAAAAAPVAVVAPRVARPPLSTRLGLPETVSPAFARAQRHAIQRVWERIDPTTLSLAYPPRQADLAERERGIDRALDAVASEGGLDGVDRRELLAVLTLELAGLGAFEHYLDDARVDEIHANGPDRLFVRRDGESGPGTLAFSDARAFKLAVDRLLALAGGSDEHLRTVRFEDGTRIDVLLPPVAAQGPVVAIRKAPAELPELDELVSRGTLSEPIAAFLEQAVAARRTLLLAGPPGSGKTQLLHALGARIPEGTRIVTVEETAALRLPQRSAVGLEAADLGPARGRIMSYAMRLAPDRILVDGLDPHNAYDFILGTAFAGTGALASLTAHGERDALARLEAIAIPSTPHHSIRGLREAIARSVHFVVVLGALPGHPQRVTKVVEVQGLELDTYRLQDVFYFQPSGDAAGGAFHPTGHVPAFYEELRRSGSGADLSIFRT